MVVPAFGEARRIGATLRSLRETLTPLGPLELIVVDDGSLDATSACATEAGADQVIRLPVNRGKGAAVRAGVLAATGSAVVFTDADLSYPPSQVDRLLVEIEAGWDVVVGNRHHTETRTLVGGGLLRDLSGFVFNRVTRLILDRSYGDTQCGLKGFHADAAAVLFTHSRIDSFAFDVEVLWLAGHLDFSVREVPVELDSAEGSTVRLTNDALTMLRDLYRLRRRAASRAYGPGGRP
ncbi:MAG: glycosyltransferase family 2 protein [Acidimicrobiales bacterium]